MLGAPNLKTARALLFEMSILVATFDTPEPWVAAIVTLRNAGTISANESFYFLDRFIDNIVAEVCETDPELLEISGKQDAIRARYGKGADESWLDAPAEHEDLNVAYERRADLINADYWRRQGAHEAADLVERSSEAYEHAEGQGRVEFEQRWAR